MPRSDTEMHATYLRPHEMSWRTRVSEWWRRLTRRPASLFLVAELPDAERFIVARFTSDNMRDVFLAWLEQTHAATFALGKEFAIAHHVFSQADAGEHRTP